MFSCWLYFFLVAVIVTVLIVGEDAALLFLLLWLEHVGQVEVEGVFVRLVHELGHIAYCVARLLGLVGLVRGLVRGLASGQMKQNSQLNLLAVPEYTPAGSSKYDASPSSNITYYVVGVTSNSDSDIVKVDDGMHLHLVT